MELILAVLAATICSMVILGKDVWVLVAIYWLLSFFHRMFRLLMKGGRKNGR